jgi:ribosome-associated protein
MNMTPSKELLKIYELLVNEKCKKISVFDISEKDMPKFLVLANNPNPNENRRVADVLSEETGYLKKIDGYHKGEWIIFDFNDIIVHLFLTTQREKYNLDRLYRAKEIDLLKILQKKKKQS